MKTKKPKPPTIKSLQAEIKRLLTLTASNDSRYYGAIRERDEAQKRCVSLENKVSSVEEEMKQVRGAVVEYMLATNEPMTAQNEKRLIALQATIAHGSTRWGNMHELGINR